MMNPTNGCDNHQEGSVPVSSKDSLCLYLVSP